MKEYSATLLNDLIMGSIWVPSYVRLTFVKDPFQHKADFADIDECAEFDNLCLNGICINTVGSFRCDCPSGYRYDRNLHTCEGNEKVFMYRINATN